MFLIMHFVYMSAFQMGGLHYDTIMCPALAGWYDQSMWCTSWHVCLVPLTVWHDLNC